MNIYEYLTTFLQPLFPSRANYLVGKSNGLASPWRRPRLIFLIFGWQQDKAG